MGMFDSVMVPCPKCGKPLEFQSKADECAMNVWPLEKAPSHVLSDIMNEPIYHRTCGHWIALIDPRFPPPWRPRPALRAVEVVAPADPPTHPQGMRWWPGDREFTYADLVEKET